VTQLLLLSLLDGMQLERFSFPENLSNATGQLHSLFRVLPSRAPLPRPFPSS